MSLLAPSGTPAADEVFDDEVVVVVDAELVVDDGLLTGFRAGSSLAGRRPLVDQHTILYPGQAVPTEDAQEDLA
ncbi:hypothetical protein [Streptomyces goshikiensis]|uniref:hypothetical protein n=1 Tax=Streptomyces goshikiensis TaxID=1942 RepID=UPI003646E0F2